jgi:type I restriction enzyme S subunit
VDLGDKRVFKLRPGELVLNIVFAWEGAVAVVSEREKEMVASHRFPTFQHDATVADLDYLLMFLQSEHGWGLMGLNSPGAAGRNRTIRIHSFLEEELPIPPIKEQREIVAFFRTEEHRLQSLSEKVREAIERLRELRTALISAAVTGRIDVREKAECT